MATSAELVARFSRVYFTSQPAAREQSTLVSRIEGGATTLAQSLLDFHRIDRSVTFADEAATFFFLALNRAPDPVLYKLVMDAFESGATLDGVSAAALRVTGGQLSFALTNQQFIDKLAAQMFTQPNQIAAISTTKEVLTAQLDRGITTREKILTLAVTYQHPQLKYKNDIDTSLIVLAAANREATNAELLVNRESQPLTIIRDFLTAAGEKPSGEFPYFSLGKNSLNGAKLSVSGEISGNFVVDLKAKLSSISDKGSNYQLVYSPDDGSSESIVRFSPNLLSNFATVDLRNLPTQGLTSVSITAHDSGIEVFGANVSNTLEGGGGNDSLTGGIARDTLYGTFGADTLIGGAGEDTFIFAPAATYRSSSSTLTTIRDFGNGADKLNFGRLVGKTTAASNATLVQVDSSISSDQATLLSAVVSNSVILVNNTGSWLPRGTGLIGAGGDGLDSSGNFKPATAANLVSLFSTAAISDNSSSPKSYIVLSYDVLNGADVWLISNHTNPTAVELSEIKLIGHIDGFSNADLYTQLRASGSIVI